MTGFKNVTVEISVSDVSATEDGGVAVTDFS